jgi:hypothetical protein
MASDSASLTPDSQPLAPASWTATAPRIVAWQRVMLAILGLGLIAMLVIAAVLSPNPAGMGTHQQLGLPPCSSVMIFGVRCPACGMTTSWAHLMHGQVIESASANTGGLLLALFAIAAGPWMLASGIRGQWWIGALEPQWVLAGSGVVMFVTLVQWIWRLLGW